MIIITFSDESTLLAQKTRGLLEVAGEGVVIVPHGVKGLVISVDEDMNEYVVRVCDDYNELDVARGFNSLEECWYYARIVAGEAGLTEEDIEADVWEVEQNN